MTIACPCVAFVLNRRFNVNAFSLQNQPDQLTGDQLTKLYFSQLREEDVRGLFEIYREDFEMFGYTFTFGDLTFP